MTENSMEATLKPKQTYTVVQISRSGHTSTGKGISLLNRSLHTFAYVPIVTITMIYNQKAD